MDEGLYFQADQKYVTVVWTGGELVIEEPLKTLEAEFGEGPPHPPQCFGIPLPSQALARDGAGGLAVKLRGQKSDRRSAGSAVRCADVLNR